MARRFGLIGENIGYSHSKSIHKMLADYDYDILSIRPQELESVVHSSQYDGFNVTIPFKKEVMRFCDELSDTAQKIGSVNTLRKRKDGTIFGDNTDYAGFLYLAKRTGIDFDGKKVLVLGSGGTSLTACAAISDSGGEVTVISRGADDNYDNIARHCDADIIVNTTPLGTCPNMNLQAVDLSGFKRCSGVVDVVYNPLRSRLVLQARELGIRASGGLPMLVSQAKEASSVFEGCEIADSEVERIISVLTKKLSNIVLIGMPGCGKTTVGALVAKRLSRAHVDIDSRIVEEAGMSVGGIFEKFGEEYFRKLEEKAVFEAGKEQGIVISTGGGAAMSKNNRRRLSHNGIVVLIKREVSSLEIAGRPLSADTQGLIDMERKRMPVYRAFADIVANNNGKAENTAEYIAEKINENTCY